jgi:4-hydroxythreonine-4-phosphate dehydrogenase
VIGTGHLRPLALTQGDPAGIGPESTLKAWMILRERALRGDADLPTFIVHGDPAVYTKTARQLGLDVPVVAVDVGQIAPSFTSALLVTPTGHTASVTPGKPRHETATGTLVAIEQAVAATKAGHASAVVTNPIAKHVLYAAGFRHPGHTEYLAELAAPAGSDAPMAVMMLWSKELAVVPVTIHVSLQQAITTLTSDLIVATARIVARALVIHFGIMVPRLVFAGLNPHAGEGGAMGAEDEAIIAPAVAQLRAEGIHARGPLPADTMFHAHARAGYDVAICMYHDQALIPIKTLAFDTGVNVTLGLPFIRTSPDHGTAFDIAGKGVARPDSLLAALELAWRLARRAA